MNILFTTIAAILIFAILIFVHELGHFVVAKLTGVQVNEFALGMGPKLFSKKKGETLYSLRLIPIGGYCAMEGEDEDTQSERSFSKKKPFVRLLVLVAGAFMNILLGFVLVVCISLPQKAYMTPKIEEVIPDSGAQQAGLLPGDEIVRANGKSVHIYEDFSWVLSNNTEENQALHLTVKNNGQKRNLTIIPKESKGTRSYGMKLKIEENNFFSSIRNAACRTGFYGNVIMDSLVNLIRGNVSVNDVSGPVGIVSEIGNAVEQTKETGWEGFQNLILLTILLTINLGIFNLLPLPALDGGRILFVLIEMIRRKPIPIEKEAIVHFVGFALLIALSIFIAFKDVIMIWG